MKNKLGVQAPQMKCRYGRAKSVDGPDVGRHGSESMAPKDPGESIKWAPLKTLTGGLREATKSLK